MSRQEARRALGSELWIIPVARFDGTNVVGTIGFKGRSDDNMRPVASVAEKILIL